MSHFKPPKTLFITNTGTHRQWKMSEVVCSYGLRVPQLVAAKLTLVKYQSEKEFRF